MGLIKDAAGGLAGGGLLGAGLSVAGDLMDKKRGQKKRGDDSAIGMSGSTGDPDPIDTDTGSKKRGGPLRRAARAYSRR